MYALHNIYEFIEICQTIFIFFCIYSQLSIIRANGGDGSHG
jgi:hypothetical protein